MNNFAIVVIGASVGGVTAMRKLVAKLDAQAPIAYFVVLHIGPRENRLASILSAAGLVPSPGSSGRAWPPLPLRRRGSPAGAAGLPFP